MQIPISIVSPVQLLERTVLQNSLLAAYYGFMILLSIVAFVAAIQFRERVFALYLCYVLSLIGTMFALNGYAYLILWPEGGLVPSISTGVFAGFTSLFGILFAADFLQAKNLMRSVMWAVRLEVVASLATISTSLLGWYPLGIKLAVGSGILLFPTVLYMTLVAYRNHVVGARYFIVAWGIFLTSVLTTGLTFNAILPTNVITSNVMQIASMIDIFVLSMALVDRANAFRRETTMATERANNYLASLNERLEEQVEERTLQLTEKNRQLENQAIRDSLTGLLNHKAVLERLGDELSAKTRFDYSVSAIMVDIDLFKSVNDEFGHQSGDKVLQMVATILRKHLRRYDVCGRYGGDEFIIVLRRSSKDEAIQFSERLRHDISNLEIPGKPEIKITASFGVSTYQEGDTAASADALVANADRALYAAKTAGRNIIRYFPNGAPAPRVAD